MNRSRTPYAQMLCDIDSKFLAELLRYEPETGLLFWRARTPAHFNTGAYPAERIAAIWNGKFADKEAFTALTDSGYRHGGINGRNYRAHRVAWALAEGRWPVGEVDHINGIRDDNRIINLRDVTSSENSQNAKLYATNKTGVSGVCWFRPHSMWRARIQVAGREYHLGYFVDFYEACEARKAAEVRHGFHPNHGRKQTLGGAYA